MGLLLLAITLLILILYQVPIKRDNVSPVGAPEANSPSHYAPKTNKGTSISSPVPSGRDVVLFQAPIVPFKLLRFEAPAGYSPRVFWTTYPRFHLRIWLPNGLEFGLLHWESSGWKAATAWTSRLARRTWFIQPEVDFKFVDHLDEPSFQARAQSRWFQELTDPEGRTLLSHAAGLGRHEDVASLVCFGAKIDQPDSKGRTPLMWAASQGHPLVCELLLAAGADPDAKAIDEQSAVDVADETIRFSTLLQDWGQSQSRGVVFGLVLMLLTVCAPLLPQLSWMTLWEKVAYGIVMSAHSILAIVHVYVFDISRGGDALRFHLATVGDIATGAYDGFYPMFLGAVYTLLGRSLLLGSALSGLALGLACVLFLSLARRLGHGQVAPFFLLLLGLLPPNLIFFTLTLREPYILVLLLASSWIWYRLMDEPSRKNLLLWFLTIGLLAATHRAMLLAVLTWMPLALTYLLVKFELRLRDWTPLLTVGVLLVCSALGWRYFVEDGATQVSNIVHALMEGSVSRGGRTTYPSYLNFDSLGSLILSYPLALGAYMFFPFPWQCAGLSDLYASGESFIRIVLIFLAFEACRGESDLVKQRLHWYLLGLYICLECVWALGTQNWGTGMRHHALGFPLLLLGSGASVQSYWTSVIQRKKVSGKS